MDEFTLLPASVLSWSCALRPGYTLDGQFTIKGATEEMRAKWEDSSQSLRVDGLEDGLPDASIDWYARLEIEAWNPHKKQWRVARSLGVDDLTSPTGGSQYIAFGTFFMTTRRLPSGRYRLRIVGPKTVDALFTFELDDLGDDFSLSRSHSIQEELRLAK